MGSHLEAILARRPTRTTNTLVPISWVTPLANVRILPRSVLRAREPAPTALCLRRMEDTSPLSPTKAPYPAVIMTGNSPIHPAGAKDPTRSPSSTLHIPEPQDTAAKARSVATGTTKPDQRG